MQPLSASRHAGTTRRPTARRDATIRVFCAFGLAVLVAASAGCSVSNPTATPAPPTQSAGPGGSQGAAATATPGATATVAFKVSPLPMYLPGPGASPTTTKTETGNTIWDALPASFPIYPGLEVAVPTEPGVWSAVLNIKDVSVDTLGAWYGDVLGTLGYSHDPLTPKLEDGSRKLTGSIGDKGCSVTLSFVPRDTFTLVLVQYGATCSFE